MTGKPDVMVCSDSPFQDISGGGLLQSHLLLSQISYPSMSLLMNDLRSSALEASVLTGLDFSSQPHSRHLSPILKDLSLKLLLPCCLLSPVLMQL